SLSAGVRSFILFVVPQQKSLTKVNTEFFSKIITDIKEKFKDEICLWEDICLCAQTSHGHCCYFQDGSGVIDSNKTLSALSDLALCAARAGADGVAPSDMQDGTVAAIRNSLDRNGFNHIPIWSYSTKFASNFYGPFRVA